MHDVGHKANLKWSGQVLSGYSFSTIDDLSSVIPRSLFRSDEEAPSGPASDGSVLRRFIFDLRSMVALCQSIDYN